MDVRGSNVTLQGFTILRRDNPGDSVSTLQVDGHDNRLVGLRVNSLNRSGRQGIYVGGNRNVLTHGSSFNVVDSNGVMVSGSGVTFNHFKVHDVRVTDQYVHNDCFYSNGPNLTVKNSRFWHCATTDLFITRGTWWNQPLYGGVTIVNNVFEHSRMEGNKSWHYYGLSIKTNEGAITELRNWRVVNNTFETAVGGGSLPAPGTIWANNVGSWSCFPGATFVHNVGKKCSSSDIRVRRPVSCGPPVCGHVRTARQGWVNPARHNFHLRSSAKAINRASAKQAPGRDLDGRRRGQKPDAGAYEHH
jgi:hypothetical protein